MLTRVAWLDEVVHDVPPFVLYSNVVAALTFVKVTEIFAFVPIHTLVAFVLNTALGPGFTVTLMAGVEVYVPQGELIACTITGLVTADEDVLVKVTLKVVVLLVAVSDVQVEPLSVEYS